MELHTFVIIFLVPLTNWKHILNQRVNLLVYFANGAFVFEHVLLPVGDYPLSNKRFILKPAFITVKSGIVRQGLRFLLLVLSEYWSFKHNHLFLWSFIFIKFTYAISFVIGLILDLDHFILFERS